MIDLTDYFDRVLVMNLDCCPERWEKFKRVAKKAGIKGFQRSRAVHGDTCQHPYYWRAGNGAWGCMRSHVRIMEDAMMDGIESYLVFEDDVCFSKDFKERLPELMKTLNGESWDQFFLGGQHMYRETSPPWPWRQGLVRCRNVNRTHAFALNKKFIPKIYQHVNHAPDYIASHRVWHDEKGNQHEFFNHIDHQSGELHNRLQDIVIAADPWLCGQGANKSNINGQKQKEEWWHDKGWY